jgi:cytochrome c biogenesis protein CcmG, thiol:disulfide interchange protein DsbE
MHSARHALPILVALVAVSCGAPGVPRSDHPRLGQTFESARGWRVEADHVGEWIPLPAPGRITVVDFWSTYCEPCIQAMPELERLWRRSDPAKVQVVGVAVDEEPGPVQKILPTLGVTFPMLIDSAAALSGAYRIGGEVPATFVIDRAGRLRFFTGGDEASTKRVSEAVDALLAEP